MKNNQSQTVIRPRELHRLLGGDQPVQLLDVRTPGEFAAAHVPGAKLSPLDELDAAAFSRERAADGSPVYVLCQSGGRAKKAIEKLERAGVSGCVLVEGGTQSWIDAGFHHEMSARRDGRRDRGGWFDVHAMPELPWQHEHGWIG